MKPTITAVIIAKNEADMIANCIETVRWCDEILVIDNGSTDHTADLATTLGARVINFTSPSFAQLRSKALKYIKTDWIFYIDSDERVTPTLCKEIQVHVETASAAALSMLRENYCYGYQLKHGGWDEDRVTRVFQRAVLKGWVGEIHESPEFEGEVVALHTTLIHLTHRGTVDNLLKSASWTPMEARLLTEAGTPTITLKTLLRKMIMETIRRGLFKKGYQDGMPGWIEALVQGMNRLMIYIQVWEQQQQPTIEERYQNKEMEIANSWKAERS